MCGFHIRLLEMISEIWFEDPVQFLKSIKNVYWWDLLTPSHIFIVGQKSKNSYPQIKSHDNFKRYHDHAFYNSEENMIVIRLGIMSILLWRTFVESMFEKLLFLATLRMIVCTLFPLFHLSSVSAITMGLRSRIRDKSINPFSGLTLITRTTSVWPGFIACGCFDKRRRVISESFSIPQIQNFNVRLTSTIFSKRKKFCWKVLICHLWVCFEILTATFKAIIF